MNTYKTGIDAISFYVPNIYLTIERLGKAREIAPEKLKRGLGLNKMSVPNVGEDAATFAANALLKLIKENNIHPNSIGRVYLGTESAVDGSKPTATYAIEIVEKQLSELFGERCFKNCDVLDMTFACVGGIDALHNSLDWVKQNPNKKAVVIASDLSKYDIASTGEYTQGAGAVAVLVSIDPDILIIEDTWGIATKSEGDFFKPRRLFKKADIVKSLLSEFKVNASYQEIESFLKTTSSEFWNDSNVMIEVFKEEPVFDGQFSNNCYNERITEAFENFINQTNINILNDWNQFIFHLPYAFHGRRIVFDNWLKWIENTPIMIQLVQEIGDDDINSKEWVKRAYKSEVYNSFIINRIADGEKASSEIGNMYTASIFMSFLSYLSVALNDNKDISGQKVGFISYGSGSKSKIFQGVISPNWNFKLKKVHLFQSLNNRSEIKVSEYEELHTSKRTTPILEGSNIALDYIETDETNYGLRRYAIK